MKRKAMPRLALAARRAKPSAGSPGSVVGGASAPTTFQSDHRVGHKSVGAEAPPTTAAALAWKVAR
ncbi:DUF6053 domain-containing protein [Lysobacter enzymogenes]|uniref:DUF6053 domain-containing protein n=1 Tax=Lysobacter enzymogenes TaxID=69 RepID=UPI003CCD87B5